MRERPEGKLALITGAARVVITDVLDAEGRALAAELGDRAFYHPLDEIPLEEHRRVIDINLHGVFLGMRVAKPAMQKSGGGSIVNISSLEWLVGVTNRTSYSASKFAVTGMTRSAPLELWPLGNRVNSIHPGVIDRPMVREAPGLRCASGSCVAREAFMRFPSTKATSPALRWPLYGVMGYLWMGIMTAVPPESDALVPSTHQDRIAIRPRARSLTQDPPERERDRVGSAE